jgi:NurA-like 5'-3' nuclease
MKMDMQQMLELLLANQKKAETKRESDPEQMMAGMNANTKEMKAKMDANQVKATKQEEMLAEIRARMDTNLKEMKEDITSGQAEMRSTICAFWSVLKETITHEMKAVIQSVRSELDETTACKSSDRD